MNVSRLKLNGWYWFSLGFYVQKIQNKNGFLFCKELAKNDLHEQICCSSWSKTKIRIKMETKKKNRLKLVGKKPIAAALTWMANPSSIPNARHDVESQQALAFPLLCRCHWQRVPMIQCWMFRWNVAFSRARSCVPDKMMQRDAVLGSMVTGSTTACGKRLFSWWFFGLLSESVWDS